MKRITLTFMILLSVFFTIWGVKMKHPINRPENVKEDTETPWYETKYQAPKADDEWTLDPEIPLNYIPVPGEDELYMVVDDSGNITNYRKRVKQADGSWVWQDVNPDIPDNYEKVDGLDNVYKVTNKDGTTEYKQYVRNDDDTYCFVPVDEKGNPLDLKNDASTISKNYVHADGNIYALYNKDNVKMGYRERVKNNDGSYSWKVADPPKTSKIAGNGSGLVTKKNQNTSSGSSNNSSGSDANKTLVGDSGNSSTKKTNSDGTYTITEKTVDTKTENGYWKSKVELFARAFACYVKDKLKESGRRNDYLCGHADSVVCETEDGMIAAYPTGEERKRFFILFDQLFIELKQLGYLHEPIDEYEFNNSHSQFKDLASKNNINLDNATQLTFADFGI